MVDEEKFVEKSEDVLESKPEQADIPKKETRFVRNEIGELKEVPMKNEEEEEFLEDHEDDFLMENEPENKNKSNSSDSKSIIIMIAVIISIFLLIFGGFKIYGSFTGSSVVDVDDMHKDNLDGKLSEDKGYLYNGFSFVKADGLWWTEIQTNSRFLKIPLHFGPKEVEDISIQGQLAYEFNKGKNVYIAIDPKVQNKFYALANSEISFNVAKGINRIPIGACTEESLDCVNRTIVNCENTTGLPVIELELSDEPAKITQQGTCIKISGQGTDYDIVKAADRLLYDWYQVIKTE